MKRFIVGAIVSVLFASCIKDRIKSVAPGPVVVGTRQLIHYWSFNNTSDSSILTLADSSIGGGIFTYIAGYIDTIAPGTSLGARPGVDSGGALRMRNPYTSMTIHIPTTGYKQPILTLDVQRSNSGPTANNLFYTVDGIHFISTGLTANNFIIGTGWTEFSFDFSTIPLADNNPDFAIMLKPTDNDTGTKGNDRYDNISVVAFPK